MVECTPHGLLLQSEGSPPLIDHLFDHGVDPSRPVEVLRWVGVGGGGGGGGAAQGNQGLPANMRESPPPAPILPSA